MKSYRTWAQDILLEALLVERRESIEKFFTGNGVILLIIFSTFNFLMLVLFSFKFLGIYSGSEVRCH